MPTLHVLSVPEDLSEKGSATGTIAQPFAWRAGCYHAL